MEMRTLEQIEQEIAETKAALNDVHGTETEVYARIVGYYRAVKHWNKGKRDEFDQRKLFSLEETKDFDSAIANIKNNVEKKEEAKTVEVIADSNSVTYELYTRQTCPNCPPVKDFMSKLEMPGRSIDVDTEAGLAEAAQKGIFASPTVIFYNKEGIETARCHNVEELEAVFNKVPVLS